MFLKVINSDSDGNGYLLVNQSEALVLEAGVSLDKLKKALDFNMQLVECVLVSHFHGDHSAYLKHYIKHFKCYSNLECFYHYQLNNHYNANYVKSNVVYQSGNFKFMPFDLFHDIKTTGFVIHHSEIGKLCFITDTSELSYNFDALDNILIEINYSDELIDTNQYNGKLPSFLADRIRNSHLSLEQVKEFLLRQDLTKVKNIALLHLSGRNSHALNFKKEIENLTGKMVHIADIGMEIDLNGF